MNKTYLKHLESEVKNGLILKFKNRTMKYANGYYLVKDGAKTYDHSYFDVAYFRLTRIELLYELQNNT